MEKVDKDLAQLAVFNVQKGDAEDDNDVYGEEDDENDMRVANKTAPSKKQIGGTRKGRKFKGISSVGQLKHLLKNYDALVESQHALLNQSIAKMAKVPPPDEIQSTFNRFQILKDSELDEMRAFIAEQKATTQAQYKDFEAERRKFEDLATKMESDKLKVSEERERIEAEVRKIRELNRDLSTSMHLGATGFSLK